MPCVHVLRRRDFKSLAPHGIRLQNRVRRNSEVLASSSLIVVRRRGDPGADIDSPGTTVTCGPRGAFAAASAGRSGTAPWPWPILIDTLKSARSMGASRLQMMIAGAVAAGSSGGRHGAESAGRLPGRPEMRGHRGELAGSLAVGRGPRRDAGGPHDRPGPARLRPRPVLAVQFPVRPLCAPDGPGEPCGRPGRDGDAAGGHLRRQPVPGLPRGLARGRSPLQRPREYRHAVLSRRRPLVRPGGDPAVSAQRAGERRVRPGPARPSPFEIFRLLFGARPGPASGFGEGSYYPRGARQATQSYSGRSRTSSRLVEPSSRTESGTRGGAAPAPSPSSPPGTKRARSRTERNGPAPEIPAVSSPRSPSSPRPATPSEVLNRSRAIENSDGLAPNPRPYGPRPRSRRTEKSASSPTRSGPSVP